MKRTEYLSTRLREVLLDGKWIANTNVKEQITAINEKQATHQTGDLNTIAALTFHLTYYLKGILNVFNGGDLEIRDKYSFDLPDITSEEDWNSLVSDFVSSSEKFIQDVETMDDEQLDEDFVKSTYGSYYRNIEGVIEHSYYHLGQMVLLSRLLKNK